MPGNTAVLVVDVLVLAGLAATIFYAVRLNRYFSTLKADQADMQKLVKSLDLAAARAETAVKALRETAVLSGGQLQEQINKGRSLFDELALMIEAGDNLADRLQQLAEKSRRAAAPTAQSPQVASAQTPPVQASGATPEPPAPAGGPRTRAERELAEAIRSGKASS